MLNWHVYVLRNSSKNFTYVGLTGNLERRIAEHNNGTVQSTKAYLPLEVEAIVSVRTERKAHELERYFKTGSGRAILKKRILNYADA